MWRTGEIVMGEQRRNAKTSEDPDFSSLRKNISTSSLSSVLEDPNSCAERACLFISSFASSHIEDLDGSMEDEREACKT